MAPSSFRTCGEDRRRAGPWKAAGADITHLSQGGQSRDDDNRSAPALASQNRLAMRRPTGRGDSAWSRQLRKPTCDRGGRRLGARERARARARCHGPGARPGGRAARLPGHRRRAGRRRDRPRRSGAAAGDLRSARGREAAPDEPQARARATANRYRGFFIAERPGETRRREGFDHGADAVPPSSPTRRPPSSPSPASGRTSRCCPAGATRRWRGMRRWSGWGAG